MISRVQSIAERLRSTSLWAEPQGPCSVSFDGDYTGPARHWLVEQRLPVVVPNFVYEKNGAGDVPVGDETDDEVRLTVMRRGQHGLHAASGLCKESSGSSA